MLLYHVTTVKMDDADIMIGGKLLNTLISDKVMQCKSARQLFLIPDKKIDRFAEWIIRDQVRQGRFHLCAKPKTPELVLKAIGSHQTELPLVLAFKVKRNSVLSRTLSAASIKNVYGPLSIGKIDERTNIPGPLFFPGKMTHFGRGRFCCEVGDGIDVVTHFRPPEISEKYLQGLLAGVDLYASREATFHAQEYFNKLLSQHDLSTAIAAAVPRIYGRHKRDNRSNLSIARTNAMRNTIFESVGKNLEQAELLLERLIRGNRFLQNAHNSYLRIRFTRHQTGTQCFAPDYAYANAFLDILQENIKDQHFNPFDRCNPEMTWFQGAAGDLVKKFDDLNLRTRKAGSAIQPTFFVRGNFNPSFKESVALTVIGRILSNVIMPPKVRKALIDLQCQVKATEYMNLFKPPADVNRAIVELKDKHALSGQHLHTLKKCTSINSILLGMQHKENFIGGL